MKKDEKKKISEKDTETLSVEIQKLRTEMAHDTLKMSMSKPKDVNFLAKKRKKLAVMLTFYTSKKNLKEK